MVLIAQMNEWHTCEDCGGPRLSGHACTTCALSAANGMTLPLARAVTSGDRARFVLSLERAVERLKDAVRADSLGWSYGLNEIKQLIAKFEAQE